MSARLQSRDLSADLTIRSALQAARSALGGSDTAELDAQALLAHALEVDRAYLFAHAECRLTETQRSTFQSALERRAVGEPIAYIIGCKGFYDLELLVTPAVLIPRPETELLLEEALRLTLGQPGLAVAEIGLGSGALAIAFARQRPRAEVYATEICVRALQIARHNAERAGVHVTALQGDLAAPLLERGVEVDVLLANLPYIASDELDALPVSRFEPRLALDGGADGLALIRRLLAQVPAVCRPGAYVLLEIGADLGAAVSRLVTEGLGADCDILQDYAGLDRIARFRLSTA